MDNHYPVLTRFLAWKHKKKIEKMRRKYLAARHSAAEFKKFENCRLLLYKLDGN